MRSPVLAIHGGAVTLGGRPILRDIDLEVASGEMVALLGANGSGKSTLVKAAIGLRPLSAGHIRLFDRPLADFADWARIGYVPQRSPIAQGVPATVAEVVASGRLARRRPFVPAGRADRAAVAEALEVVGLADRARDPVATLSGGQQQRVLIARALAGRPDVFFLDEPNAGVDLVSQDAIAGTLARLVDSGSTIVVVLHELGPFAPLVRRTVVLREGRIAYDGLPPVSHAAPHADHCEPTADLPVTPDITGPLEKGTLQ